MKCTLLLLANGISGETSYVQLLDEFDGSDVSSAQGSSQLQERGFLSPLAAQGTSEEHFSPCETREGHPARSQVEDAWQTGDVDLQASQIQGERDKADMLAKQLQACREEAAWLRSRVCQLQQNNYARDSAAARAAALSPSHTVDMQALQQRRQFHANICPSSAAA
ncbi:TPA: hypothetical protein ACH3X3_005125 [Trebouxia sp. C0006]